MPSSPNPPSPAPAPAGSSGASPVPEPVDLSIIVPAYNEAQRLGPTVERLLTYLEGRAGSERPESAEILVVDDGSTDRTAELVEGWIAARGDRRPALRLLRQGRNRGKGAALRRGVLESRGRRVLLTDADLSVPIEDLERLEAALEAADAPMAIGSRGLDSSELVERQPWYRELMGKTFNRIIHLFGFGGFRDTQCGFKLLEGDVARDLFSRLTTDGFAFDVELVWLARRAGHRVVEVGVRWVNSADSRVHPVRDSLGMLRDVALIRWRQARRGRRARRGRPGRRDRP